jgi:DNA-binding transcriptional regulator of glucitol operon
VLPRLRFLTPGWLALHLGTVGLVVTMVLLGRWQLDVSDSKHFSLQNFGYAIQWWVFSLFVLAMWLRVVLDARRRDDPAADDTEAEAETAASREQAVPYRRYVMPQSSDPPAVAVDPEQAAYNDYLARLAADSAARGHGEGTSR